MKLFKTLAFILWAFTSLAFSNVAYADSIALLNVPEKIFVPSNTMETVLGAYKDDRSGANYTCALIHDEARYDRHINPNTVFQIDEDSLEVARFNIDLPTVRSLERSGTNVPNHLTRLKIKNRPNAYIGCYGNRALSASEVLNALSGKQLSASREF